MEDAVRALQQQVNALMSQNAALEAQLPGEQNTPQGLAELLGAITTVLSRAQAPTRRMVVDQKGCGKPPVFSGREEDFYVWAKKVENCVSGVFPNVRGVVSFAVESHDAVTATAVALGLPELEAEMSTEIDGQLFIVLSALTDSESFDVVISAGGDHGFESWRKLHRRWDPFTAGRARSLLREILSPSRVKLLEFMGLRKDGRSRETLRWSTRCPRKRAQSCRGHPHESLEALLPDDLEKHVQLNCARLNSYGVLREEINTYCECRGHAARNAKQKGSSHPGGDDTMDIGAYGKGMGKQGKCKHGKGKGKGQQGQQGRDRSKDKDKDSIECWHCGKRGHYSKDCWSKKNTNKGGSKGKHTSKNATDAHKFDSTKPANVMVFSMLMHFNSKCLNGSRLESTQVQERRHGPRVSHTGRGFLAMLTSLSAQRLESLSNLVRDCTLKVATIGESISEFAVFKRRCVNHCCLLESTRRWVASLSCMVTKVTCSTGVRMLRRKIDAWIQKEMRDSQYNGCTVVYKENNVYNNKMKPRGNKTDAMPLSDDSANRSSARSEPVRPGNPDPEDPGGAHDSLGDDAMVVKSSWCRGCQIY